MASVEARRLLHAFIERVGARLDELERRFAALERIAFEIDGLEERIARVEQRPPAPIGGPELQRLRAEAVLRIRRDGYSHQEIADATGVSKAGVRRILIREGDPAPRPSGGQRKLAHASRNGDRR